MGKIKVPKSIAGVKIPKKLRKAGLVDAVLNHPVGRTLMAEALVAGAGAAAAALTRQTQGRTGNPEDDHSSADGGVRKGAMAAATGAIGGAIAEIVRSALTEGNGIGKDRKKARKKARKAAGKVAKNAVGRAPGKDWTPHADPGHRH